MPVKIRFVKGLTQEPIVTHRLRMDEDTSIGMLFSVVQRHLGNGESFRLVLGKHVWTDPTDVYVKLLHLTVVQDALGANVGDVAELQIGVISLGKPGDNVGSQRFLERSLRTHTQRSHSIRSV